MQLSFYAKSDLLVSHPTAARIVGQHPRYVGRKVVVVDGAATWPATQQPFVCESDTDVGRRCAEVTRKDGSLWPANEATARACNIEFVPVEFSDGAWRPAPKTPTRSAATKKD
jgi:hypothetical protein